jgi:hypothetical protein
MRAFEFITEAVGGNYLYHGVPDGSTAMAIIKSGFIKPNEVHQLDRKYDDEENIDEPDVISLTRDQSLRFPYGNAVAQFVVDKDALIRAGIKVKPEAGVGYGKSEKEERAWTPIPVKPPFVVAVQVDPNLLEEIPKPFLSKLKKLGVRVEPWKNFKEPVDPKTTKKVSNAKGKPVGPDWKQLYLDSAFDPPQYTLYYKIPGWTYGKEIRPFLYMSDKDFAKKILKLVQDRTRNGQGIKDIQARFDQDQHSKTWKKGNTRLSPGDPGYVRPELPTNE